MTDEQLDKLIASTAIITDEQVAGLPLQLPADQLCEEIMSEPIVEDIQSEERRRFTPRWLRPAAVAAVAAVFMAALGLVFNPLGGGADAAWAAPLVELAESSPRLLLNQEGWNVSHAQQTGDGESGGEMTFVNGDRESELHWKAVPYQQLAEDRRHDAALVETGTVLESEAQISQYNGGDFTAVWAEGDQTIEFRTGADSLADFVDMLDHLERVDSDTWLSALPDSVIQAAERGPVVQEILADMPTPDGFNAATLESGGWAGDRYDLGVDVTSAVGCAWLEQWVTAVDDGDTGPAEEAEAAMATSHEWPILIEMDEEGDLPELFWELADEMAGDTDAKEVWEFYGPGIGCAE